MIATRTEITTGIATNDTTEITTGIATSDTTEITTGIATSDTTEITTSAIGSTTSKIRGIAKAWTPRRPTDLIRGHPTMVLRIMIPGSSSIGTGLCKTRNR